MDNPFQMITDTFHPDYRVNLSIQGLDGSIMLTLSNERGVVAKRLISAAQRNDPQRLPQAYRKRAVRHRHRAWRERNQDSGGDDRWRDTAESARAREWPLVAGSGGG